MAGTGQYRVLDRRPTSTASSPTSARPASAPSARLDRERVAVKSTNAFSEEWDVLTSSGFIRRGELRLPADLRAGGLPGRRAAT